MNQGRGRLPEQKRVNPGPYRIQQLGRPGTLPARVLSETERFREVATSSRSNSNLDRSRALEEKVPQVVIKAALRKVQWTTERCPQCSPLDDSCCCSR